MDELRIAKEVAYLEHLKNSFSEIYKEELEVQLRKEGMWLEDLSHFNWAKEKENLFYKIRKETKVYGMIFPFRKLILHNIGIEGMYDKKSLGNLKEISNQRGYHFEFHKFAWQDLAVVEDLKEGRLPKNLEKEISV